MSEQKELRWISGFWRRIGAFSIDVIILGAIGLILGLVFSKVFIEIGGWGKLVGFIVAIIYFGIMNSSLTNGQTIGKKLLNIRVVDKENKPISLARSFARFSVLGIPYFLNGAHFSNEIMYSPWIYVLSFVIFGGMFSIIYLYVFNRNTRQSLHDLIVGTFVVNTGAEKQNLNKIWSPHIVVVGILFLVSAIVPMYTMNLAQQEPFTNLLASRNALMKNPQVMYALTSKSLTKDSSRKYLSAVVFLNQDQVKNRELAKDLAIAMTDAYGDFHGNDTVTLKLIYGYDIGIASYGHSFSYRFKANEITK